MWEQEIIAFEVFADIKSLHEIKEQWEVRIKSISYALKSLVVECMFRLYISWFGYLHLYMKWNILLTTCVSQHRHR